MVTRAMFTLLLTFRTQDIIILNCFDNTILSFRYKLKRLYNLLSILAADFVSSENYAYPKYSLLNVILLND